MKLQFILVLTGLCVIASRPISADESFRVYAPSRTTNRLLVVDGNSTRKGLSLSIRKRVDLGFPGGTIAAHPDKPLLYITPPRGKADETVGAVVHLNDEGGYASHDNVTLHHGYSYLSLDRGRRFLLGANYFDGFVDVYKLDGDGMPANRAAALNEGRRNAHCILPSRDNRFVYIPYVKDTNAIYQYRFDENSGALTALTPKNANPPAGTGPRHMAYHPTKPFAYFSNEQHLGVSVYRIRKGGQLEVRQVCDAVGKEEPKDGVSSSDIVITPDGRFLFAGIRGHKRQFDWVSRYRVKDNGTVELLGLTPADKIPWGLTLTPRGRYLLVTAFQGATLTAFEIGDDGGLKKSASLKWDKSISDLIAR